MAQQTSNKVCLVKDIHHFPSLLIDLTEVKGESNSMHVMLLFSRSSIIFTIF